MEIITIYVIAKIAFLFIAAMVSIGILIVAIKTAKKMTVIQEETNLRFEEIRDQILYK